MFEPLAPFLRGLPGISVASVIGISGAVNTGATPQDVIVQGGTYGWLTSAQSLEVVSSSASDATAGTGIAQVQIDLLDATYAPTTLTVTLNGTTPVALTGTWLRVNDMRAAGVVGSAGVNVGTITLRVAGGGATVSQMAALKGRAQQSIYTVPLGRTAYAAHTKVGIIRSGASNSVATVELQSRAQNGAWITRNTVQMAANGASSDVSDPPYYPPFAAKTDVRQVVIDVSNNGTTVTAAQSLLLIDSTVVRP